MTHCPGFSFFISGEEIEIFPDNPLWHLPLSGNLPGFLKNDVSKKTQVKSVVKTSDITIGEYLTAARTFLTKYEDGQDCHLLSSSFAKITKGRGKTDSILKVELFLEKHGAFYHPIRVKVFSEIARPFFFVLNGAVTDPGLALIQKEYQLLSGFEKKVSTPYTPRVFGAGNISLETRFQAKKQVGFFLGEWFEGYQEFHISKSRGNLEIAIWASNGDISYLPLEKALIIYEQIAYILTSYYNVYTGEQIFPWHHAAGDFIVNPLEEGFTVKLITVRGYEPLMEFDSKGSDPNESEPKESDSGGFVLPSLLFFFLSLTLRMQMDRLDGTGSTIFLGKAVLEATAKGFLRALDAKTGAKAGENKRESFDEDNQVPESLEGLGKAFTEFMTGFSPNQILTILVNLTQAWHPTTSEGTLIQAHLESHCAHVYSIFKNK
jgi:hypothetical protein